MKSKQKAMTMGAPGLSACQEARRMRVLIVDDHPMVREGIRVTLAGLPRIEIVGQAADGLEALGRARELRPDLIFMDISMPRMNGIEATKALRRELPGTKVIILTVHESKEYLFEVIRSGARGYMVKDSSPEDMYRAIQAMEADHGFFSPQFPDLIAPGMGPVVAEPVRLGISTREKEVLVMITQGLHNKEIAERLGVSLRTVLTYRERIYRKLRVKTASELTKVACTAGLLAAKRGPG